MSTSTLSSFQKMVSRLAVEEMINGNVEQTKQMIRLFNGTNPTSEQVLESNAVGLSACQHLFIDPEANEQKIENLILIGAEISDWYQKEFPEQFKRDSEFFGATTEEIENYNSLISGVASEIRENRKE